MMSDHWKILANILGTPGPAEPLAKETPKKKPEPETTSEKLPTEQGDPDAPGHDFILKRDPLADIVDRKPEPTVPGFVIPEPVVSAEKPAKRSAWDTLIGSLGIKTAPEPDAEIVETKGEPIPTGSAVKRSVVSESTFGSRSTSSKEIAPESQRGPRKRGGFGSGLVDDRESDSWDVSNPTPAPEIAVNETRRSTRDDSPRESTPSGRSGREDRHEGSRSGRPAREGRPATRSEVRPATRGEERGPRNRDDRSGPRTEDVNKVRRPAKDGFADGLIDWDDADDDASLFVEPDRGEVADVDDTDEEPSGHAKDTGRASRDDNDRPRGRGRRGGSRNRGRDDSNREKRPVSSTQDIEDDVIGWDSDPVDDTIDSDIGDQTRSRRGDQARREPTRDPKSRPERSDSEGDADSGPSRRRGRRGQRQQMSAPDSEPQVRRESSSRTPELDFVDDDLLLEDDEPSDSLNSTQRSVEPKEAPNRSRRRRGRRGRGGRDREDKASSGAASRSKEPVDRELDDDDTFEGEIDTFGPEREPFAAELEPDLIDEALLDDDHEDDEEVERIRRGRRRGRGSRGESRSRGEAAETTNESTDPSGNASAEPKHRNVPTWLDTVSLLVDSNIERHRRSGASSRSPQGRGGRR